MNVDYDAFFKKYENIVKMAEAVFEKVKGDYQDCVRCKVGCSDCCHALFDLTLIEALYLNHQFNRFKQGKEKADLIEKANTADRQVYKIKRKAYKASEEGKDENEILEELAMARIRCPLLNQENQCDLYEYRPITCRIYGIPTVIGDKSHTCGLSGFEKGKPYPTVKLENIQTQLYELSNELVKAIKSKHIRLSEILVPVSMVLVTDYNDDYMGISDNTETENDK